jgi:hypothetical protein
MFSMARNNNPGEGITRGKPPPGDPDPRTPGDAAAANSTVDKIVVVKDANTGLGWRNDSFPVLQAFVTTVHTSRFMYSF